MHDSYKDIHALTPDPPTWYDKNGCPRWGAPAPRLHRFMGRIRCQHCNREFLVCMADPVYTIDLEEMLKLAAESGYKGPLSDGNISQIPFLARNGEERYVLDPDWHYGDPPFHGCIGDSMNSIPEYEWEDEWEEVDEG